MNFANYMININLHVWILFTFLGTFFFLVISKLEEDSVNSAFNGAVNDNLPKALSTIDENKNLPNNFWTDVYKNMDKVEKDNTDSNLTSDNHRNLKIATIATSVILILLLAGQIWYCRKNNIDIEVKSIIIENLIIFALVGTIEYFFFTKIASHYLPTTPTNISVSLLDDIKAGIIDKYRPSN